MKRIPSHLLAMIFFASCAFTANAQNIKIGDEIHLKNKFSASGVDQFIDTQGRLMDFDKEQAKSHNLMVVTNNTKNRDNGSGTWKIIAFTKKVGEPLAIGDRIAFQNMFTNGGYLSEADAMWKPEDARLLNALNSGYPVFTANQAKGNPETWVVVGANNNVKNGTPVTKDSWIRLESAAHPKFFLTYAVSLGTLPRFKGIVGRSVMTVDRGFTGNNESGWFMLPK